MVVLFNGVSALRVVLTVVSLVFTLLCLWIVIPPASIPALITGVAAIELSPYLLVLNVAAFYAAALVPGGGARLAASLAAGNVILCALPIAAVWTSPAANVPGYFTAALPVNVRKIPINLGSQPAHILAYLPSSDEPAPIVFVIYGGAWQRGSPENDAVLNRALAREGYAVFALDYRHAPQFHFPDALNDVRQQMAFIRKNADSFDVDPNRVAVLGHSAGGELAELIAFEPGSRINALVSYSGAIDLVKGYSDPPRPDPIDVKHVIAGYLGATPREAPQRYRDASPIAQVRTGLPPALLVYRSRDHVVDISYARKFRDELRARGNRVKFLELPWAEHAFEFVPYGLHAPVALRATIAFLKSNL
ncbi:MAG: hypothetical protein NVS9B12_12190 [Vulcanimicrobiaceae bacterium]